MINVPKFTSLGLYLIVLVHVNRSLGRVGHLHKGKQDII